MREVLMWVERVCAVVGACSLSAVVVLLGVMAVGWVRGLLRARRIRRQVRVEAPSLIAEAERLTRGEAR
jgi:hypothetical protein